MSDPAKYRPEGELDEKKKSDPIAITRERLTRDFGFTEETFAEIAASVEVEAKDAWDFAIESPEPDPAKLYDFTYAPEGK